MDNKREFFTGIYYHTSLGFNKLLRGVAKCGDHSLLMLPIANYLL